MAKLEAQKALKLQKWMKRADYEATLRVVVNPKGSVVASSTQEELEENEEVETIEMVTKFHDFIDRSGVVIDNHINMQKDSINIQKKLQKLLK